MKMHCGHGSPCDIIGLAKRNRLTEDDLDTALREVDDWIDTTGFFVATLACSTCQQTYIYCFRQYSAADSDDDAWAVWIPAYDDDINDLKRSNVLMRDLGDWIAEHDLICLSPDGKLFWAEGGHPPAAQVFVP